MMYICIVIVVATVTFNQSVYYIDEDIGVVQPVLILSKPSSTNITVQVIMNNNAGEYSNKICITLHGRIKGQSRDTTEMYP